MREGFVTMPEKKEAAPETGTAFITMLEELCLHGESEHWRGMRFNPAITFTWIDLSSLATPDRPAADFLAARGSRL
jgi:hypothetical protein